MQKGLNNGGTEENGKKMVKASIVRTNINTIAQLPTAAADIEYLLSVSSLSLCNVPLI